MQANSDDDAHQRPTDTARIYPQPEYVIPNCVLWPGKTFRRAGQDKSRTFV